MKNIIQVDGFFYYRTAWTGGSVPSKDWLYINRALVEWFMQDQLQDMGGQQPTAEQLDIFRGRAGLDAWATAQNPVPTAS